MPVPQWYTHRVREDLKRIIAQVICNDLRDPRVPSVMTITELKLSSDTRNATVHVSYLPEEGDGFTPKDVAAALNHAAPFIQHQVAQSISIKHLPKLVFKYDGGFDHSRHITELLDGMKDELDRD